MLYSIAVTTDFSSTSKQAFGAARSLVEKLGGRLHLLHVAQGGQVHTPWNAPVETPGQFQKRHESAEQRLRDMVSSERVLQGVRVEPRVLQGESADAVRRFQEHEELDLIVIASHGSSGVQHFALGSFATKVLQVVSCPVLVIRIDQSSPMSYEHGFRPKHFLVPHDFSRASHHGLEIARAWARAFEASVKLLYVVEPVDGLEERAAGRGDSVSDYLERVRAEGLRRLDLLVSETDWESIPIKTEARVGQPAAEILKEASSCHSDLIVMASRGLSVVERLRLGSVADRIIHRSSCPVLVVRQKGSQDPKLVS